jgi:hypothetical protein
MKDVTPTNISFSSWAAQTYAQKKDILELMLKSDNALDRMIANDILQTAGVDTNA